MELIEIIIYVLKLFSLSSFILLTLSYFFFKLKDRTRIKPYMLVNNMAALIVPEETEKKAPAGSKKYTGRFKVVNEEQFAEQYSSPDNSIDFYLKSKNKIKENKSPEVITAPTNIYSFYSITSEPMHKLKLSAMA